MERNLDVDTESMFRDQMDEAWSHYRHCEQMRTQYLNFFFTVFMGASAFIITLCKTDSGKDVPAQTLFAVALLIPVLFCFSVIIFVSTIRVGYVLDHYIRIMQETRLYFFGEDTYAAHVWQRDRVAPAPVREGLFRLQVSARLLVGFLTFCLLLAEGMLTFFLARKSYLGNWKVCVALGCCVGMAATLGWLTNRLRLARREESQAKAELDVK
jgi:hypothetical protein